MDYEKFVLKVAFDKELNPFHASFSLDKVLEVIKGLESDGEIAKQLSLVFFLILSSSSYKEFYQTLQTRLNDKELTQDYFLYSLALSNRDSLIISGRLRDRKPTGDTVNLLSFYGLTTSTAVGDVPVQSMVDVFVDLLDFNFSLLRFTSGVGMSSSPYFVSDTTKFDEFHKIFLLSNYFQSNRAVFDHICFEGAQCRLEGKKLSLRIPDPEYLVLKAISQARIQSTTTLSAQQTLNNRKFAAYIREHPVYCQRQIESVRFSETTGEIMINLSYSEYNRDLEERYVFCAAFPITYHYYLSDAGLRKLNETIRIFVAVQYVFQVVNDFGVDHEKARDATQSVNPNFYLFRIRFDLLIKTLEKLTGLPSAHISSILKRFQNDGTSSFWERPLLRSGQYFYPSIHAILYANMANMCDIWLQNYSDDFEVKGFLFEDFVKSEVEKLSKEKGFLCKIAKTKKFSVGKETEELDLVWESAKTVVVAEVKNVRYPFTARNANESKKILNKAIAQVNRKTDFLLSKKANFPEVDWSKRVVKCVITSIPFLTGMVVEDVAVIDFNVINQYISLGFNAKTTIGSGEETQFDRKSFYANEQEYSERLKEYIFSPSPVREFKPYFQLAEQEYTMGDGTTVNFEHATNKVETGVV